MNCHEARELMSGYLEQYLADHKADLLKAHLAECESCRVEMDELKETLQVVHEIPHQESVVDLWEELMPKLEEIRAEMRLSTVARTKLHFRKFWESLTEGAGMFVTIVPFNLSRKLLGCDVEDAE